MGLLKDGLPLTWEQIVPHLKSIKEQGINQFIQLYHRTKNIQGSEFKWGDEVEFVIIKFDHEKKKVRVATKAHDLLDLLQAEERVCSKFHEGQNGARWTPEFAGYMIEGIPEAPYGGNFVNLAEMEGNLHLRRELIRHLLDEDETLITVNFPSVSSRDFSCPPVSQEEALFPEESVYSGHPRFKTVYRNTDSRRRAKCGANVPIFRDVNTPRPFRDVSANECANLLALPDHIYLDHAGLACLQVTMQAPNMGEARWLYDQLTPITPIMLALSASTPIYSSYLSEVDCRWDVLCATSDDRAPEERGIAPSSNGQRRIRESRFGNVQCYIHPSSAACNDIPLEYDKAVFDTFVRNGIDEHLAKHVAHMFIRDPLQVFEGRIQQDDKKDTEHFETIQSSIWMNMRFKPPPAGSSIGWRVEFRPMELQLTDFENAAYACFVVLLARVLLSHKLSFVMPISQVNENITRSQRRDAVLREKLHFRSNVFAADECGTVEMTLNEIVNGNGDFPGLVPLIRRYLSEANIDAATLDRLHRYLDLIQKRASGELWTLAHWMRDFVATHPLYKRDSYVSDEIVYDMLAKMKDIADGRAHSDKLLGNLRPLATTENDAEQGVAEKRRTSATNTRPVCWEEPLRMRKR